MGKRANRKTPARRNRRAWNIINSRRLARVRRTEEAWEAEKAAPVREAAFGAVGPTDRAELLRLVEKTWPLKNRIGKRHVGIWGITKSMLSRSRRQLNDVVVAD